MRVAERKSGSFACAPRQFTGTTMERDLPRPMPFAGLTHSGTSGLAEKS